MKRRIIDSSVAQDLRVGAAVAIVVTGCGISGEDGTVYKLPPLPAGVSTVPASRDAARVVGGVRARFLRAHHEVPGEHRSVWEELEERLWRKDIPALKDAEVQAFVRREDGRLAPVVRVESARVSLAATADGATRIASVTSTVSAEIALRGASPVPAEVAGGYVTYRDAMGRGAHVIQRATADGTEDYVVFPSRPSVEELIYHVDVTQVAGVRVVEGTNTVELLSGDGTPRLHMSPPSLVDAKGETHMARVGVSGCSYDTDPHGPWGRPVTAPGSSACEVRVSWERLDAPYPILVDPAWMQTGVPLIARAWHQMVLLDDGTAMSLGGWGPGSTLIAAAEIWNKGTWAATAPMNKGRMAFQARTLDNGDVVAIGGAAVWGSAGGTTTDRWSKATATWIVDAGSDTKVDHGLFFGMAKLASGKLLAVSSSNGSGAASKDAEVYDPTTRAWTVVANMNHAHGFLLNQVVGLADGRGYVIGGSGPDGGVTEFYDPIANTWTDGPMIQQGSGRGLGAALVLDDGKVFISGIVNTVETLDLTKPTPAWVVSSPSPQTAVHVEHTACQLLNGHILLHGSAQSAKPESQTWDPITDTWSIAAGITKVSDFPASVRFADARVLVTGGSAVADDPNNNSSTALVFGCTSYLDCAGAQPFCEVSTGKCLPCLSDNGSSGPQPCQDPSHPFCDTTGACFPCKADDVSHCGPGTSACDTSSHVCTVCNGNYGSGTSAPCPAPTNPFCNDTTGLCDPTCTSDEQCDGGVCATSGSSAGACIECVVDADCLGHAGGPACDPASGTCRACHVDAQCADGQWCDAAAGAAGACQPKRPTGQVCTRSGQCQSDVCEEDRCGAVFVSGGGPRCTTPAVGAGDASSFWITSALASLCFALRRCRRSVRG